jgi:outer membrane protein assembly factor BamD (BamD/ComL family)
MKRAERQHLKDNELLQLAATARDLVDERRGPVLGTVIAIVVIVIAVGGYVGWKNHVNSSAHTALASALAIEEARVGPPAAFGAQPAGLSFVSQREKNEAALAKYKEVADSYPSTDAGQYARYREGATYMALGDAKNAAAAYQQVIDRAGNGVYGQMARLGLAEAQAQSGDYEAAINTFRELSQRNDSQLPVDGLLMRLGRTQADAGKASDAQQTFTRLVEEFPDSPFTADARKELDQLKKAS